MKRYLVCVLIGLFVCSVLSAQSSGKGISFDFGLEPEKTGNSAYGIIQYGWTDTFSSRFDLRYSVDSKTEYSVPGYGNAVDTLKTNIFEISILPYVKYFGIREIEVPTKEDGNETSLKILKQEFSFIAGVSYQYSYEDEFAGMFDVNGIMLNAGDEGKYFTISDEKSCHIYAPKLGFTAKIPVSNYLNFNFEGFVHPFYFLVLKQNLLYHSDQTSTPFDYSGDNTVVRFSSPYINLKAAVDVSRFFRLMSSFSYQRLDFQQMDWASDWNSLTGYDDVQTMISFRAGVELLPAVTNGNRKTHLRCGVYRQIDYWKSTYSETNETKSKWVLNLGTEL